jgi:signal transduction histidine kinase/ActR/RegA family two-component response regulator
MIVGGGEAGEVLRSTDWATNPLGPVASWPISLQTMVRAMLNTRQPTCLFWGPSLVSLHNDGFIPLLGEKHPAAMGQPARELWSDAWPVVGELLNGVASRGEAVMFAEMLIPIIRGGVLQDAWWNYSYSPAFDDAGDVVGVLVVATETTEAVAGRKALEAAKRDADRARQEFEDLFAQAPLPMAFLKGEELRFSFVNEPYQRFVGRGVVGRRLAEAFSDDEVGYYLPLLQRVFETGEPMELKETLLRLLNPSGTVEERFIDVNYRAVRDPDGTIKGVLAVIHDVTLPVVARSREHALRKSAERASIAKDEFLALVSHELRTPLNAMLGWARLLDKESDPARLEKGLTVIRRNAEAQSKLIEDILDVSRITSGKVVIESQRVELRRVIENAVDSIRPGAAAKGIALDVAAVDPSIQLVADENRLQQVVWNLLSNAVKFTPAGGKVQLRVEKKRSAVAIEIADNGKGIDAELLPHVFDRFIQGDASTTKRHGGLGLGLAIVRHIVELHGGTVTARSEGEGRGATFHLSLPIRAVMPEQPAAEPTRDEQIASARSSRGPTSLAGTHILVVDDERDAREMVAEVLEQAGASVTVAASARDALAVLDGGAVDLVVSDIGMPDQDGYKLIEQIRARATGARIPAVALTAYAREQERARALAAGFQAHAAKPVDLDVLLRMISELINRGAASEAPE